MDRIDGSNRPDSQLITVQGFTSICAAAPRWVSPSSSLRLLT